MVILGLFVTSAPAVAAPLRGVSAALEPLLGGGGVDSERSVRFQAE